MCIANKWKEGKRKNGNQIRVNDKIMRKQHTKRDFSLRHTWTLQKYRFLFFFSFTQTKHTYTHLCDDDDDEEEHICLLLVQNCLNKWFCFCHDVSSSLSMSLYYIHPFTNKPTDTNTHKIKQKDTKINLSANGSFVCCCSMLCSSHHKNCLDFSSDSRRKKVYWIMENLYTHEHTEI